MSSDPELTIRSNLQKIRERIEAAATKAGRKADEVTLVAVTKYVDADATKSLVDAGQLLLGESRPQVLWEKAKQLNDCDIRWHLIGHLQRNKVARSLPYCSLIHSVDSIRLLDAINTASRNIAQVTECLLEVNISGEGAKHGFCLEEVKGALESASQMESIKIRGFMGMASFSGDLAQNEREFAKLRELRDGCVEMNCNNIALSELSMGMSNDFEVAIAQGATIVRIGSILFAGV